MRFLRGMFFTILVFFSSASRAQECVVLLHGLSRTDASFLLMEEVLRSFGYAVVNKSYPSTDAPVDQLKNHITDLVASCGDTDRLNFVTHSLGGILVRAWLVNNRPSNLGRVVMLGPPNQGSEIVDSFGDLALYEILTGPAGIQLGTGEDSVPRRLGPADFEVGVIAGNLSINPFLSAFFDGPNDGKVSVESTKLEGMTDHIVLPATHTFMMNNPLVIAETLNFLQHGRFDPDLTMRELFSRALAGPSVKAPQTK